MGTSLVCLPLKRDFLFKLCEAVSSAGATSPAEAVLKSKCICACWQPKVTALQLETGRQDKGRQDKGKTARETGQGKTWTGNWIGPVTDQERDRHQEQDREQTHH